MKAEHRKALEKNELADKLTKAWEGVSSTSPKANRAWFIALGAFVAIIAWYLFSNYSTNRDAARWSELEFAGDIKSLQKIVEDGPGTTQAQVARFYVARLQVTDAASKLASQDSDERVKAADAVESARKTYDELSKAANLPTALVQEAMFSRAELEELLASVPTASNATAMRGSLDQASKYYNEAATRFPRAFAGELAAKRAERLKTNKEAIEKLYAELAKDQGKSLPEPSLPSLPSLPTAPSK